MHEFNYHNIFETKGIEYLLTIVFFAVLIPFWLMLNRKVSVKTQVQMAFDKLSAGILRIPKGLFYSQNHTWTHLEKSGTAKVGLNDFLQQITGEVQFTGIKSPGEEIKKGELLTEIVQNGKKLKIFSPVSGRIVNTNENLLKNPELISINPYEKGWIYSVEPSNWIKETNTYFLGEDAMNWISKELERFKDFLAISMKKYSPELSMVILQDGGELRNKTLLELPDEIWQDFQKEFLD